MKRDLPLPDRARSLRQWFSMPLGQQLAQAELSAMARELPGLFGYHLVVIDPPWPEFSLDDSRIPHRVIQRVEQLPEDAQQLSGDTENWPIMTDAVDAIVLPHTLELARDPHQVLREADRSLIPDGHLVITGFNPRSLWGLRRLLSRKRGTLPWSARFRSISRIKDWLGLLGFDVLQSRFLFQRPPLQSTRLLSRLQFLEPADGAGSMLLSGAYILVARKRSVIMTPLHSQVRKKPRLFPVGIPSSSQGNVRRSQ